MEDFNVKLRKCPFCRTGTGHVRLYKIGYRIVCKGCGAGGPIRYIQPWHDNKFVAQCQAAKAWNRRENDV